MFATARAILKQDPAARSLMMVMLTYPGLHALGYYRIAHWFHIHQHYLLSAIISRWAARRTGVLIAPGAVIGQRVFIDHGIGVVIGETAIIEDDVTILHGVTIGARHITSGRRHPHIGHHSFIGAHAQILGPITIGSYIKIGANAVVLEQVPQYATAVGNPAQILER